jgi:hypothetical protein
MATKPTATTGMTGPAPAGNPMNLTCVTKTGAAGDAPSMVMIVLHSNGQVPNPGQGWNTYLPANANVQYIVHDDNNGSETTIGGSGVAIFYK